MTKKAAVVSKQGKMSPNGREGRLELRMGENGQGALIQRVTYWPWSPPSCDEAWRAMKAAADRAGVEIVNHGTD